MIINVMSLPLDHFGELYAVRVEQLKELFNTIKLAE